MDGQFVVDFFENSIAQVFQADVRLADFGCRVKRQKDRLCGHCFHLRTLFGDFTEMGDGIVVDLFQVIQISEGLDIFLTDLSIFTISVREGEKNSAVLAAVFLNIHGSNPSKLIDRTIIPLTMEYYVTNIL